MHYWLCTLPAATRMKSLVATIMGRWRIERDYQDLNPSSACTTMKDATGVDSIITAAFASPPTAFSCASGCAIKNSARLKKHLPYPEASARAGLTDAASRPPLDRDHGLQSRPPDRPKPATVSLLRHERAPVSTLLTQ